MKNIIICGAGQVGFNLARYLIGQKYNVTIIDHDPKLIARLNERFEAKAITGHASDPHILKKAGADHADMLIAVTYSDEVNIVVCEVSNSLFHIPKRIARIRNQAYLDPELDIFSETRLSIDHVISPEREVAQAIARGLEYPGAFDVVSFADGAFKLVGLRVTQDSPIVNTPLMHINSLFPSLDMKVVGIRRNDHKFVPSDREKLMAKDEVYFLTPQKQVNDALFAFGYQGASARRVMILGGGNIGLFLAKYLEQNNEKIRIVIVEKDSERAQLVAQELQNATVICGDALESEILKEAGVLEVDTVVAVTQDDRVNTLSTLLAKRLGAKSAMALTNKTSFGPLVLSLGVDAVITPRQVTVSSILCQIRQGLIRSIYSLGEDYGELIELDAVHSVLVGLSVQEINDPESMLIAGILRGEETIIPSPSYIIKPEDRLIIMMAQSDMAILDKILSDDGM